MGWEPFPVSGMVRSSVDFERSACSMQRHRERVQRAQESGPRLMNERFESKCGDGVRGGRKSGSSFGSSLQGIGFGFGVRARLGNN